MNKKLLALALSGALTLSLLAACGSFAGRVPGPASTSYDHWSALPRTLINGSISFAGTLSPRIHCVGFDPTMPSGKKIFNLVSLKGWT